MVANRIAGVRATVFYGPVAAVAEPDTKGEALSIIEASRLHNDANVLSIGARYVDEATALTAVTMWLATAFSQEERHTRRMALIDEVTRSEV